MMRSWPWVRMRTLKRDSRCLRFSSYEPNSVAIPSSGTVMRFTATYYHSLLRGSRAFDDADVELSQLFLRHGGRRTHQQILRVLRKREPNHCADVRLLRQQHHDAIDARRETAVGRRAVAERPQHAAESLLHFLRPVSRELERAQHHIRPVIPDRAARQLDAVADDV